MRRHVWDRAEWRKSSRSGGTADCVEVAVVPEWRKSSRSGGNGDCVEVAVLPEWRKSSRSNGAGNCVEVAVAPGWRKSSRSNGVGDCVEVAALDPAVGVRDSKNPAGPILVVTPGEWTTFLTGVRHGEFDR